MARSRTITAPDSDIRHRPDLLRGATTEDTIKLLELLFQQEMHFNTLCAEFKKMASIWLLSAFAGIGFVATNDVSKHTDLQAWTIVGLIGIGASIGIVVLWLADLRVYQRLLSSVFFWRGAVEYKAAWLPPIHKEMIGKIFGNRVGFSLALIYVAPFCATAGVGIFGLYKGWIAKLAKHPEFGLAPQSEAVVAVAFLAFLAFLCVIAMGWLMYQASTPKDDFDPRHAVELWGPPIPEAPGGTTQKED